MAWADLSRDIAHDLASFERDLAWEYAHRHEVRVARQAEAAAARDDLEAYKVWVERMREWEASTCARPGCHARPPRPTFPLPHGPLPEYCGERCANYKRNHHKRHVLPVKRREEAGQQAMGF